MVIHLEALHSRIEYFPTKQDVPQEKTHKIFAFYDIFFLKRFRVLPPPIVRKLT